MNAIASIPSRDLSAASFAYPPLLGQAIRAFTGPHF